MRVLALHELHKLENAIAHMPEMVDEELSRAALEASIIVTRNVKDVTPVGVSRGGGEGLQASIRYQIYPTAGEVTSVISSPLRYVEAVEMGARKHMPPVEALKEWAEARGLNPWAVAMNIAKYGTNTIDKKRGRGHEMFKTGFKAALPTLDRIADSAVSRILQRADAL